MWGAWETVPAELVRVPFVCWRLKEEEEQDGFAVWRSRPSTDLHTMTVREHYAFTQLVRYSLDKPSQEEVILGSEHMDAGWPFAQRTIFAGPFDEPTEIELPKRVVGFIHLEVIPDDLAWFIEQVRKFDKTQNGKLRIQINPVKPSSQIGKLKSKLITNDGGVLSAYRQQKDSVFESSIWASTHIRLAKQPLQTQHQPAWVTACIGRPEMNTDWLSVAKAARGCVDITIPKGTSDQELILTGLRYFVSQYNSYSRSLIFSQGAVQAYPSNVKLNMLHSLMYDPIAQISLPDKSKVKIMCGIDTMGPMDDEPHVWPGDDYSLWHLAHSDDLHPYSKLLLERFWNYVRKPCEVGWSSFKQNFDDYTVAVEREFFEFYNQRFVDFYAENVEPQNKLDTLKDVLKRLTKDYPDDFNADDQWNLERLRFFLELDTLISSISNKISDSPHREYQVLLCQIQYFGDILQKISNLFKFASNHDNDCIPLFVIRGDEQ